MSTPLKKRIVVPKARSAASLESSFATVEKVGETAGVGCLVQLIGFAMLFGGLPFGMGGLLFSVPIGLGCLFVGGGMARKKRCGKCKNPVASALVKLCPACGAKLLRG